jgi:hypothetical protein
VAIAATKPILLKELLTRKNYRASKLIIKGAPRATGWVLETPLDFVGLIGQLDGPKSQLINNVSLDCSFCSLTTLSREAPTLLRIAHASPPEITMRRPMAINFANDTVIFLIGSYPYNSYVLCRFPGRMIKNCA